jgi:hypothetical protein
LNICLFAKLPGVSAKQGDCFAPPDCNDIRGW